MRREEKGERGMMKMDENFLPFPPPTEDRVSDTGNYKIARISAK